MFFEFQAGLVYTEFEPNQVYKVRPCLNNKQTTKNLNKTPTNSEVRDSLVILGTSKRLQSSERSALTVLAFW